MPADFKTIIDYGIYRGVMFLTDLQNNSRFRKQYGDFNTDKNYEKFRITSLNSESGIIFGTIIVYINSIEEPIPTLLLPGENDAIKNIYKDHFKIPMVINAGVHEGMDYFWDFERSPPDMGKFKLVVSQAILEHLINPYKHMEDLSQMLDKGGYLIVHSVMPGYFYHRWPVDCQRFYPDWFEEMAKRLNLRIVSKHLYKGHIFYMYCNDL